LRGRIYDNDRPPALGLQDLPLFLGQFDLGHLDLFRPGNRAEKMSRRRLPRDEKGIFMFSG
jgi:hypothetical protein